MPSNVIDRVHALASKQKVPEGISFLRNDNSPFPTLLPRNNNTRADVIATSEGVNDVGDAVVSDNDDDSENDNYEDARDGNESNTEEDLNNNEDDHPPGNESDTEEDLEIIEDDTLTDTSTAILEGVDGGTE